MKMKMLAMDLMLMVEKEREIGIRGVAQLARAVPVPMQT